MSDWTDLLDLAGDIVGDAGGEQLLKQGEKLMKKLGLDLTGKSGAASESAAALREKQQQLKAKLKEKHPETGRLEPERLVPEKLVPERMEPETLKPDYPVPEGESTDLAKNRPVALQRQSGSDALQHLTSIAASGLGGAILVDEILEPPLALRSGYLSRYRRRTR